jgi:hypothetical protein
MDCPSNVFLLIFTRIGFCGYDFNCDKLKIAETYAFSNILAIGFGVQNWKEHRIGN